MIAPVLKIGAKTTNATYIEVRLKCDVCCGSTIWRPWPVGT